MKSLQFTIRAKLMIGLALCAAVLILVGWVGVHGLERSNASVDSIYADNLGPILQLAEARSLEYENRLSINEMLLRKDALAVSPIQQILISRNAAVDKAWGTYYPAFVSGEEEEVTARGFMLARQRTDKAVAHVMQLASQNHFDEADQAFEHEVTPHYDAMLKAIKNVFDINHAQAKQAYEDSGRLYARVRLLSIIVIGAGLCIMLSLLVVLVRAISSPLNRAVQIATAIAGGKLNHRLKVDSGDEVGRLLHALKSMDEQLTRIVSEVRESSDAVATASRQISQGNDDLSQRTQEQASSLEETAASMEEMTASVKQNSVNATHAAKLVKGSLVQAESGKLVVTRTTEAMMEIYTASQRIEEIITLMDEIAFQTNLLALNAAVEAAHAGDHGRGFGVVAIEVRNLAQRSKNASHEIKGLIRTSSEKVEAGQLLVDESGQALKDIFESINKVSDLVDDIAAASSEQSTGINQITMAVSQIDEVTQQNAALVEEAASASRAMQEQAAELMRQVSFFDVM